MLPIKLIDLLNNAHILFYYQNNVIVTWKFYNLYTIFILSTFVNFLLFFFICALDASMKIMIL